MLLCVVACTTDSADSQQNETSSSAVTSSFPRLGLGHDQSITTTTTTTTTVGTTDRREAASSSWSGCEPRLTDGFGDDTIRIGVRSFYEDWSFGNELFTAYLEHVKIAGERRIEVVQLVDEIPPDIALLADFSSIQIPLGHVATVPDCLPVLSARYSQPPATPMDVAMPALTAESEMALWAALLDRAEVSDQTVAALVLDYPAGHRLLAEFEQSVGPDIELVTVFHSPSSLDVDVEIAALLAAEPDVLLVMTFGESCRQAVLAVEESSELAPEVRMVPAVCALEEPSESAWDGWLSFRQPVLAKEQIEPTLLQALEDERWSDFPHESRSVLAAWWVVDAVERGAFDRRTLLDNLLTTSSGPEWFSGPTKFATQGSEYPLVIEGGALVERQDGAWGHVDFIEVDPT